MEPLGELVNIHTARQPSCGKLMFSIVSVCPFTGGRRGPAPLCREPWPHYETHTVGKCVVGILLECFLVLETLRR